MECGLDEGLAGLRNVGQTAFEDFLDFVVTHHLPQAIGAEQHIVTRPHGFDEPVHLHVVFLSQAAMTGPLTATAAGRIPSGNTVCRDRNTRSYLIASRSPPAAARLGATKMNS